MRKIEYTFTTVARQFMFIACFLYVALRCTVITQILLYKIDQYYEAMNFTLTYIVYVLIFVLIAALFFQHRFFFCTYTRETLTYHNKLLHRNKTLNLEEVSEVICDTKGAYFYYAENNKREKSDCDFMLPYFRGGRIEILDLDKLFKYLQSKGVNITKGYRIMPGYGSKSKILSFVYGFITLYFIGISLTPIQTVIVLFSAHH